MSTQFDPKGYDPTWVGGIYKQPNPYVRLKQNNGIYPASGPNRTEYYLSSKGGTAKLVSAVWDRPLNCLTISGGPMYTPTQHLMGIPRLHAHGLSGKGVSICVLDDGWSGTLVHPSIELKESYNPLGLLMGGSIAGQEIANNAHHLNVLSVVGARKNTTSQLIGTAYGSDLYAYNFVDPVASITRAISKGVKILVISQYFPLETAMATVFTAFQATGGMIFVASGNGGSSDTINPLAAHPGVVSVATYKGGTTMVFEDVFTTGKIQPLNGKVLDFALPHYTIAAAFDSASGNDYTGNSTNACYKVVSGTSFTAPDVAGFFALLMERYPYATPAELIAKTKKGAKKFTYNGIVSNTPKGTWVRF